MNMGVYCLPFILILVSALSSVALSKEENSMVYSVSRRLSGDIYNTITLSNSTCHFVCTDGDNLTFLVSERRCVNNKEFFNDCNFIITATDKESSIHRLALIINYQNADMITAATSFSFDTSNLTDAVVYHRPTSQPVKSTFCQIISLEVYRGRNEAIKISHDGFHLNQSGAIEINPPLGYSIDEYTGELYRMNLSCNSSGGGLPETAESGCLFFKVIGIANIQHAKFDFVVPGTKSNNTPPTTTSTPPITLTTNSTSFEGDSTMLTTTISTIPIIGSGNIFEFGSPLFYIVIGAGSSMLILLLIILTMLTAICFLVTTRGKSYTFAVDDQSGDRESSNSQGQGTRAALVESVPQPDPIDFNLHDSVVEIVSESLYAEIGERNTSSPSPPPLPPPLKADDLIDEEGAMIESNYQANVSVPSHLKWPTKRISRVADHDLAYLYEGHDTEFELPFYPKQAGGVTGVADSLYDDPTSLSLTPAPVRVQDSHHQGL